ncbi:hypothetical protein [Serratia sp. M24T3]|uniref:hypothetical protein n=1 Tax=Serratia sp. M24T3 TaxID=932213 RepID=UPI00025BBCA4|nr:hypothetical protein [Serratia sp. M24T3]EIC82583.1 hypothetical protein SPM24T3_21069 [Serratia sp. M24T3]
MPMIKRYTPNYVVKFKQTSTCCTCLSCKKSPPKTALVTQYWKNQQRESVSLRCESACRAVLLDPQAFMLDDSSLDTEENQVRQEFTAFEQALNQQCINLAIAPQPSFEESLFALGILVSKAESLDPQAGESLDALLNMAADLQALAENGQLQQQYILLPPVPEIQAKAFKTLGKKSFAFALPKLQKMALQMALSELSLLSPAQFAERHDEIKTVWQDSCTPYFAKRSHIWRNYLLYCLYHQPFSPTVSHRITDCYFELLADIYELKTLLAIALSSDIAMDEDSVIKIFTAFHQAGENQQETNPGKHDLGDKTNNLLNALALICL